MVRYIVIKRYVLQTEVPLLDFVEETLLRLGFNPKKILKVENKKVWLYNSNEVEEYLGLVGTSNQRLKK